MAQQKEYQKEREPVANCDQSTEVVTNYDHLENTWAYVSDLVRSAKRRIVLIDNFVDDRVLSMLTKRASFRIAITTVS